MQLNIGSSELSEGYQKRRARNSFDQCQNNHYLFQRLVSKCTFWYFSNCKNKFSLKPPGKNLREQVAWTILAETVIARSQESGEDLFSSFVILIMFHLL